MNCFRERTFIFQRSVMEISNIDQKYRALLHVAHKTLPQEDLKKIRKALNMAIEVCGEKNILTGESSVSHALSVAKIIADEMGLGTNSIISALLHDSSDILITRQKEVEKIFGKNVVDILKGFSKISGLESSQRSDQAENFRKLLLSLAEDVRVILITLVERLEYMRNLDKAPLRERIPIASDTYYLYAPLAHRLGFYNLKSEMEDLAMKYLEPEQYTFIENRLKQTTSSRNRLIREFSQPVREKLEESELKFTIKSRTKSIHSIWQKMKKQGVDFEEVYDLFAVRVILDSKEDKEKSDCWQAYSVITDLYQPNPSRMRDWISVPKSNGYESLHTTVIGPKGKWVEVQIRTKRMDEIAEKGLAAHYRYKGGKGEGGLDGWLTRIREILESPENEESAFIDQVRSGLYADEVFVFTPKGDIRQLPIGSTVLDFAFDIHSQLGATCVAGKVNGKNVTIKHVLQNGDHVSILTSKNQKPKSDWLSFAITSKARSKIKQALNEEKVIAAAEGKEILLRRLKNWKIPFGDSLMKKLLLKYQLKLAQDLFFMIGTGKIEPLDIKDSILNVEEPEATVKPDLTKEKTYVDPTGSLYSDYLIIEEKLDGIDYKLAKCCNPVYGDSVFGFVTISEGIKIHRTNCPNAGFMLGRYPYRSVMARWTKSKNSPSFFTGIKVSGIDDISIVNKISEVLSQFKVNVRSFNYNLEDGLFEGKINLYIANTDILHGVIKKIQGIKGVLKATRFDN
jgi:guanosine-3',5'-bis(diphosphate) 3'-pyrophosphohydrolase